MQRKKNQKSAGVRGRGRRIGIVAADYNSDITEKLLAGARSALLEQGVGGKDIGLMRVPGSFELPLGCARLARSGKYDALVALGCVIRGETDHYAHIARAAAAGIMSVMLDYGVPVGFGLLTVNNLAQARARSGEKNNKGREAALAALFMAGHKKMRLWEKRTKA